MPCNANVTKGRQLVFLIRNDTDTEWELLGGLKVRGYSFDNPVEDVTSSSTQGDYTESEFTGYSTATLNISGVADKRTGVVDPATNLNIVGAGRLATLATTGNRCGKFKMINLDTNGFIEGDFAITAYSKSGDTPGLLSFDATLQSKSDIIVNGDV